MSSGSQVFLHILADTLGSVGVIISAILMNMFNWMIADPICSIFIAVLIAISVFGLVKESAGILMQRQPKQLDHALRDCYRKVRGPFVLEMLPPCEEDETKPSSFAPLNYFRSPNCKVSKVCRKHIFGPYAAITTSAASSSRCQPMRIQNTSSVIRI